MNVIISLLLCCFIQWTGTTYHKQLWWYKRASSNFITVDLILNIVTLHTLFVLYISSVLHYYFEINDIRGFWIFLFEVTRLVTYSLSSIVRILVWHPHRSIYVDRVSFFTLFVMITIPPAPICLLSFPLLLFSIRYCIFTVGFVLIKNPISGENVKNETTGPVSVSIRK